jgi:hypothetical protein
MGMPGRRHLVYQSFQSPVFLFVSPKYHIFFLAQQKKERQHKNITAQVASHRGNDKTRKEVGRGVYLTLTPCVLQGVINHKMEI